MFGKNKAWKEVIGVTDRRKDRNFEELYRALAAVTTPKEVEELLDDICTINEINAMQQRLTVAKLLDSGLPYNAIVEQTGVSTATISRVNRCLVYGSGGYRRALDGMKEE